MRNWVVHGLWVCHYSIPLPFHRSIPPNKDTLILRLTFMHYISAYNHVSIAENLSARLLILLRMSFCVGMFVCMYVCMLRNANFCTLRTRISVSC